MIVFKTVNTNKWDLGVLGLKIAIKTVNNIFFPIGMKLKIISDAIVVVIQHDRIRLFH